MTSPRRPEHEGNEADVTRQVSDAHVVNLTVSSAKAHSLVSGPTSGSKVTHATPLSE